MGYEKLWPENSDMKMNDELKICSMNSLVEEKKDKQYIIHCHSLRKTHALSLVEKFKSTAWYHAVFSTQYKIWSARIPRLKKKSSYLLRVEDVISSLSWQCLLLRKKPASCCCVQLHHIMFRCRKKMSLTNKRN